MRWVTAWRPMMATSGQRGRGQGFASLHFVGQAAVDVNRLVGFLPVMEGLYLIGLGSGRVLFFNVFFNMSCEGGFASVAIGRVFL